MYLIKDVTTKALLLTSILFLSGCSTFDIISSSLNAVQLVAEEPNAVVKKKVKKVEPVKNWNPPKVTPIIPTKTETPKPTKEERNFPWWAFILAIVSGTAYLINMVKHNNKR